MTAMLVLFPIILSTVSAETSDRNAPRGVRNNVPTAIVDPPPLPRQLYPDMLHGKEMLDSRKPQGEQLNADAILQSNKLLMSVHRDTETGQVFYLDVEKSSRADAHEKSRSAVTSYDKRHHHQVSSSIGRALTDQIGVKPLWKQDMNSLKQAPQHSFIATTTHETLEKHASSSHENELTRPQKKRQSKTQLSNEAAIYRGSGYAPDWDSHGNNDNWNVICTNYNADCSAILFFGLSMVPFAVSIIILIRQRKMSVVPNATATI